MYISILLKLYRDRIYHRVGIHQDLISGADMDELNTTEYVHALYTFLSQGVYGCTEYTGPTRLPPVRQTSTTVTGLFNYILEKVYERASF